MLLNSFKATDYFIAEGLLCVYINTKGPSVFGALSQVLAMGVSVCGIYQWDKRIETTMICSLNFSIKLEIASKVLCGCSKGDSSNLLANL